jgi:trk system potassium uptake protein TrkA
MRVIVVGAGEVGSNTAESLAEDHEVVVIDLDGDRVESLEYSLDVLAIQGDGTDLDVLEEAGVGDADLVIASTSSDEANIVTCGTVKTLSDAFTIARVKKPALLRTWERSKGAFGVDFMVSVDLLTARDIVRIAGLPGAQDVDTFADGTVSMAQFSIGPDSPVANQTVREADRYDSLTFAALLRDDDVEIPSGETRIEPGDELVVIGSDGSCRQFAAELSPRLAENGDDVVVVGGGSVGYQVARLLGEQGRSSRLIESRPERAREIAESLPDTVVLEHDATDIAFLEREHVGDADFVISTCDSDERNLLVSLLAKRLGASRTVAVVETSGYVDLFETVGVDVAVNPREVTAEEITRFTRAERAENVAIIASDRAEVLEIEVDGDSVLAGRRIRESMADLPEGVVVGAITRIGETGHPELITPRGETVIEVGDHVVVFVDSELLDAVAPEL